MKPIYLIISLLIFMSCGKDKTENNDFSYPKKFQFKNIQKSVWQLAVVNNSGGYAIIPLTGSIVGLIPEFDSYFDDLEIESDLFSLEFTSDSDVILSVLDDGETLSVTSTYTRTGNNFYLEVGGDEPAFMSYDPATDNIFFAAHATAVTQSVFSGEYGPVEFDYAGEYPVDIPSHLNSVIQDYDLQPADSIAFHLHQIVYE